MHAIVGMVAAGLGVSLVPESIRMVQPQGLVYRRVYPSSSVDLGMVHRRQPGPVVQRFLETVAGVLAERE